MEPDYRLILDALGEAVIAADRTGHITYANAAAESLLGWEADGLRGLPLTAVIPPHLRSRHTAGFNRYRNTWSPHILGKGIRVPARRRNGVEIRVELTLTAFRGRGGVELYLAALHPLTAGAEPERPSVSADALKALLDAVQYLEGATSQGEQGLARQVERALEYHFEAAISQLWFYDPNSQALTSPPKKTSRSLPDPPAIAVRAAMSRETVHENGESGPLLLPDVLVDGPIAGIAAVPLLCGAELLGVLVYGSRSPISRESLRPLAILVSQVVGGLESLRRLGAEAERDRRIRQVAAVLEIASAISNGSGVEGALDCIVRHALQLTGLDEGIIVVQATGDTPGSVRASAGSKRSRVGETLLDDTEPAIRAITSGLIEVIDDGKELRNALLRQRGVRCAIAAPIWTGAPTTVAALQLAGRKANRGITTEDVDTTQLLAAQAALALAVYSSQS